mmetsp:Transcript_11003/g.15315  ORF Transcript_11003/g.15315 Transcript_11003/m.15315 type:complete len:320 (+) Transcript_11003:75-1034(+)
MTSTLRDLHERLTEVENKLFVPGHFKGAEAECKAILNDSYTKTDPQLQACTVILCIQAMFEQRRSPKDVDKFVLEQYETMNKAPYQVFAIWFQFKVYRRDLRSAYDAGVDYLMNMKDTLERWQYEEFTELLVFHCLTELGEFKPAMKFLRNNKYLSDAKRNKFIKDLHRLFRERSSGDTASSSSSTNPKRLTDTPSPSPDRPDADPEMKQNENEREEGGYNGGEGKAISSPPHSTSGEVRSERIRNKGGRPSRWRALLQILHRVSKRMKEIAPVFFAIAFVAVLLVLMRNAVSSVRLDRLKAEAKRFLSLFFALDPLSA